MTSQPAVNRGVYVDEVALPYRVYDADHHIYPPTDARIRHLPKKYHAGLEQIAGFGVPDPEGDLEGLDEDTIANTIGTHPVPQGGFGGVDLKEVPKMERLESRSIPIPGAMLNRLNPMKDIDLLSRAELVDRYNEMRPAFERKEPRLKLMDVQGVETAVVHTGGFENEPAFRGGDLELGYAVTRAWNEYVLEDWGFNTENRILAPLQVPLVDPDRAVAELTWGMDHGAVLVNLPSGDAYGHSPFDPMFDPVWARINEAGLRIVTHLGGGNRVDLSSVWSENPDVPYPRYDAFQWVLYWSDRPVMETVTAMIFHNLFGRFPNVKALFAEFGAVWLPYLIRKLDHAAMLGRRPTFGELPGRPSQLFKEHCLVAPYPEENITRAAEVVGWDCLVFGSDFPHSEGLPDPVQYVRTIENLGDDRIRKVMRDNLRDFLALT
jgi:predicted TIM-barrel fold metal-dependent hydrolase